MFNAIVSGLMSLAMLAGMFWLGAVMMRRMYRFMIDVTASENTYDAHVVARNRALLDPVSPKMLVFFSLKKLGLR